MKNKDTLQIEIKKRPWYAWVLWGLWLFLLIFFAQNAIASRAEYVSRATTIFWAMFAILLIGGGIVYYIRQQEE